VALAFTPRVVESLRPRITQLVDQLLDAVALRGRIEVMQDLAFPLPLLAIAELIGVPASDRERLKAWSFTITRFTAGLRGVVPAAQAETEFRAYLAALIADRRANPTDDLLGRLVTV